MDSFKYIVILLFYCIYIVISFNLDVAVPIVKQGPDNSYFGFAVSQTKLRTYDSRTPYPKLFVGAPTTNDRYANVWNKSTMQNTGAFLSCPYTYAKDDCKFIPFGKKNWSAHKTKFSNMFYGGSIAASEDILMVCGYKYIDSVGQSARWARGYCQEMSLDEGGDTYSIELSNPCQFMKYSVRGHTEYGMSQCGYSLDVQNSSILWGAPGSNDWRGAMFKKYSGDGIDPDGFNGLGSYLHTATDIADAKEEISQPLPVEKFSYLGSKVKFGNIFTNKGSTTYITGAPRSKGNGQVLLFEKDRNVPLDDIYLTLRKTLTGFQFGSKFGDEIATVDLNGDGKDDLIVGAPYYSESRVGGIVYIYYSTKDGILFNEPNVTIKSRTMENSECQKLNCERAKFGYSINGIGDTDSDGYQDLAIGAPFEGNGAVYIYRGSKDGVILPYSQRISADDLVLQSNAISPIKSFGFSIADSLDIDNNGYNDIAIGAYQSNQVVILRSRPVVDVSTYIRSYDILRPRPVIYVSTYIRSYDILRSRPVIDVSTYIRSYDILRSRPIVDVSTYIRSYDILRSRPIVDVSTYIGSYDVLRSRPIIDVSTYIRSYDILRSRPIVYVSTYIRSYDILRSRQVVDVSTYIRSYDILRSRPIVDIKSKWEFLPNIIDPNVNCEFDNEDGPCIQIKVCFQKNRKGTSMKLEYRITIEEKSRFPRMYFKGKKEGEDMLKIIDMRRTIECREHIIYAVKNNKNFLTPVKFRLTYQLDPNMEPPKIRNRRSLDLASLNNYPVLNDATAKQDKLIEYKKNCGKDNICLSDLRISAKFSDKSIKKLKAENAYSITVSGKKTLDLIINIENTGEDAHEANFFTTLPSGLSYISNLNKDISCLPTKDNVSCSLGNPMSAKSELTFQIRLNSEQLIASTSFLKIDMHLNTTSKIKQIESTILKLRIKIIVELDIEIIGFAGDDEGTVYYSGEISDRSLFKNEIDVGSLVEHTYEVTNKGVGNIERLDIPISWPVYIKEYGKTADLLYLMEEPTMLNNNGRCYTYGDVNELKLKFSNSDSKKKNSKISYDTNEKNKDIKKRRTRRGISDRAEALTDDFGKSYKDLNCNSNVLHCMNITCELKDIEINQTVTIVIKARLRNSTFLKYYKGYDYIRVSSTARILIDDKLPISDLDLSNNIAKAMTTVKADARVQTKREIPYWIIIIAIIGGILLLLLMILILWKCGFFKRQQLDEMQSHQVKIEKNKLTDNDAIN